LTAVLLQRFAELAAAHVPNFEILDFAKDTKPDAPSGTGRELALRLGNVGRPNVGVPLDQVNGPPGGGAKTTPEVSGYSRGQPAACDDGADQRRRLQFARS
jgi:hypothetical protein